MPEDSYQIDRLQLAVAQDGILRQACARCHLAPQGIPDLLTAEAMQNIEHLSGAQTGFAKQNIGRKIYRQVAAAA